MEVGVPKMLMVADARGRGVSGMLMSAFILKNSRFSMRTLT